MSNEKFIISDIWMLHCSIDWWDVLMEKGVNSIKSFVL